MMITSWIIGLFLLTASELNFKDDVSHNFENNVECVLSPDGTCGKKEPATCDVETPEEEVSNFFEEIKTNLDYAKEWVAQFKKKFVKEGIAEDVIEIKEEVLAIFEEYSKILKGKEGIPSGITSGIMDFANYFLRLENTLELNQTIKSRIFHQLIEIIKYADSIEEVKKSVELVFEAGIFEESQKEEVLKLIEINFKLTNTVQEYEDYYAPRPSPTATAPRSEPQPGPKPEL